jgi:hypothetical protein
MTFTKNIQSALAKAQERAALEVQSWIPDDENNALAGEIIELGAMTVRVLDTVPTTVIQTEDGLAYRVSWGGAVLRNKWQVFHPQIGDFAAFHYHGKQTPKAEGFNDYDLIEVVVLNADGSPKRPILSPTANGELQVNTNTDEVSDRTQLQPGEQPFAEETTE